MTGRHYAGTSTTRELNSDEQREDRWARLAASTKPKQLDAIKRLEEKHGYWLARRRDTALPHIEVETRDGRRWRVWPSGVTELIAEAIVNEQGC